MIQNLKTIRNTFAGISLLCLLLISLFSSYGCHIAGASEEEGKIIYDVTYEDANMNTMMKAMLPKEVVTYFNNNMTCTVLNMGMNMMETRLISDLKDHKYTTLVSAMGQKKAMVLTKNQVDENYKDRVELKVMHTDEYKEIAGKKCRQAMITDSTDHTYPVYYSEDFGLSDPNWSSPFHDIKGVLMEYSISFGNLVMKLKAREIIKEKNDPALFMIPAGYEIIKDPKQFRLGV